MPAQTPQQFIKSMQTGGALLVRNNILYFVPDKVLAANRLEHDFGGPTFKGPGILLVRHEVVHFIPQATLDNVDSKCKFPAEFSSDFTGISPLYFKPDSGEPDSKLAELNIKGKVWKEFRNILSGFAPLDGISQAIFLAKAEDIVGKTKNDLLNFQLLDGVSNAIYLDAASNAAGKLASKAEKFKQIMFLYDGTPPRILVSMVKGGRPSDR